MLATIRVPANLRTALGDDPAATIAALLELRAHLAGRTPASLRENPFLDVAIERRGQVAPVLDQPGQQNQAACRLLMRVITEAVTFASPSRITVAIRTPLFNKQRNLCK